MDHRSSISQEEDHAPRFERQTLRMLGLVLPPSVRRRQIHEWQDQLDCTRATNGDSRRELIELVRSAAPIAWTASPAFVRVILPPLVTAMMATLLLWPAGPASYSAILEGPASYSAILEKTFTTLETDITTVQIRIADAGTVKARVTAFRQAARAYQRAIATLSGGRPNPLDAGLNERLRSAFRTVVGAHRQAARAVLGNDAAARSQAERALRRAEGKIETATTALECAGYTQAPSEAAVTTINLAPMVGAMAPAGVGSPPAWRWRHLCVGR